MSLYKQLVMGICLFTLTLFCASFYLTLDNAREQYQNQLMAHAQDSATALGLSLTVNIDDPVMTELLVNSIFDRSYFSRIEVTDLTTQKKLIEQRQTPQTLGVPDWFTRLVQLEPGQGEAVVMKGWQQVARVEVESHPMFALDRLWKSLVASFLLLSGGSVVCVAVGMVLLHRRLRPLNYVVEQAMAISRREFLYLPKPPATPELRRVVEAMNVMVAQLKARFSEQASRSETLHQQAYSDSLTGLHNSRAFKMKLHSLLDDDEQASGVLLLLRVQDLIGLNQRKGGAGTDQLLMAVSEILSGLHERFFNGKGFLARIRGSELALIAPGILPVELRNLTTALTTQLTALYHAGLSDVNPVACFAQVTLSPDDTPQKVMLKADQMLTIAETGLHFVANDPSLSNDDDRFHWHARLDEVLRNEAFELFSQPVFRCDASGTLLHEKILSRIRKPDGELIPAGHYLPWIHCLGLGKRMDQVMLSLTLKAMEHSEVQIALSICGESVEDEASMDALLLPLRQTRAQAARLTFELDENELPAAENVSLFVQKLNALGCRLGIQHFGGRFHLIGNLPHWGLAWLKVDGSFIRNIDGEEDKKLFIEAVYWATRQIDLPLIAERVETAGELAALTDIGLHGAMGRFFSDASTFTK
ncbi:LapD/MoxY N-terminal periplasmic domain-containing protein [Enterobacter sp. CC120223-11]|uniref:bifunctional diguanylate cyclase/phosphodiesterase n=1 Tax=Enterobacter sp. CC120223-11 TaxID=1378073 RepID=UPI000BC855D6|nr:LapD/MoxY N-terminal periplasmic domain-containing protein [Enterobacter sp. CC120223-11]SNY79461.1 diguanylate cyclase/phosphodiesterase [Enterobacter sp. CC120223-11]